MGITMLSPKTLVAKGKENFLEYYRFRDVMHGVSKQMQKDVKIGHAYVNMALVPSLRRTDHVPE